MKQIPLLCLSVFLGSASLGAYAGGDKAHDHHSHHQGHAQHSTDGAAGKGATEVPPLRFRQRRNGSASDRVFAHRKIAHGWRHHCAGRASPSTTVTFTVCMLESIVRCMPSDQYTRRLCSPALTGRSNTNT